MPASSVLLSLLILYSFWHTCSISSFTSSAVLAFTDPPVEAS
ncbi:hypothetical protein A2U01_0098654, partial [Trifolium medium]|nr:hypothetical protein [Trifolium medium]